MRPAFGNGDLHGEPEAPYGEIYELPGVCQKLGLSYDHRNDAAYEYDGETTYVREGKDIGGQFSGQGGDPFLQVQQLQEEFGDKLEKMEECTALEIRNAMLRLTKLDIPAIPDFRVAD